MMDKETKLQYEYYKEEGKTAKGRKDLLNFFEGKRLTMGQTLYAMCYQCMGGYDEKKEDCGIHTCPLHPYMPFNRKKLNRIPNRSATHLNGGKNRSKQEEGI